MAQQRIGRYAVLEEIASGAQGTVYRAHDPESGRVVALKVLHPELSRDAQYVQRFRREATLAASIDHPNIVRIFDVGEAGGLHYMAVEFLPESLARIIEAGPLPVRAAAEYGAQIAEGLAAAHATGVIHRDIKPQNVLIGADGEAKITDFGIARGESFTAMTATGVMMGTPHYMAPELVQGERATEQADIYALGCVLYQMLAGEVPFTGTTPMVVLNRHVNDQPRPIESQRSDIPRALAAVVARAMEKDPTQRFHSAGEMAAATRTAVPGIQSTPERPARTEPALGPPPTEPPPTAKAKSRPPPPPPPSTPPATPVPTPTPSPGDLLWRYKTGGFIAESLPAVVDGVVYVGSTDHYVYALNAPTGDLLWRYQTGGWVYFSPAVADGVVYVGSADHYVYALDAPTGDLLWRYQTGDRVSSSPAVADGVVYVGSYDNYVYALDASTGDLLWRYQTGRAVSSSPAVADGVVYVGSNDRYVYAVDASTGELLWRYQTGNYVYSSPAEADGVVYVGSFDDYVYALDASTGDLLWRYKTDGVVYSSPAVTDGIVYVGSADQYVYALDAPTGDLLWRYETGGVVQSSPAVADGVVYVGSYDNNVYAIAAGRP